MLRNQNSRHHRTGKYHRKTLRADLWAPLHFTEEPGVGERGPQDRAGLQTQISMTGSYFHELGCFLLRPLKYDAG